MNTSNLLALVSCRLKYATMGNISFKSELENLRLILCSRPFFFHSLINVPNLPWLVTSCNFFIGSHSGLVNTNNTVGSFKPENCHHLKKGKSLTNEMNKSLYSFYHFYRCLCIVITLFLLYWGLYSTSLHVCRLETAHNSKMSDNLYLLEKLKIMNE